MGIKNVVLHKPCKIHEYCRAAKEKVYMQEKDFLNHFLVVNAGLKITFGNHRHNLRKYGSAFVHTAHTIMS